MFSRDMQIRVRYGETDRMGYLYYGYYAQYYEVGRVEALRSLGLTYKELEDSGIILPVLDLQCSFLKPAYYDDLLTVRTVITKLPDVRIHFTYDVLNPKGDLINVGKTTLVFYDQKRQKPIKAPETLIEKLRPFFS